MATSLAAELFTAYKSPIGAPKLIQRLVLIPAGGGAFDVVADGELVFSKKQTGRFPEPGEVADLLKK